MVTELLIQFQAFLYQYLCGALSSWMKGRFTTLYILKIFDGCLCCSFYFSLQCVCLLKCLCVCSCAHNVFKFKHGQGLFEENCGSVHCVNVNQ